MKPLYQLTKDEYAKAKSSGMFWEWFPEATGNYQEDVMAHYDEQHEEWERFKILYQYQALNKGNSQLKLIRHRYQPTTLMNLERGKKDAA